MKTRRLAVPGVSFRGCRVQGGKGTDNFNNKNMAKRETSKGEETANAVAQVLEELKELRQEVRLAIETATNAPYKVLSAAELRQTMGISENTLRRYEKWFGIPVRKIGKKKFYLEAEVKNCILTALQFWKD